MRTRFRFHLLGLPHTATNRGYNACAYTQKILKFVEMMGRCGHDIIHYGNEGSVVMPDPSGREPVGRFCEHVEIFTEEERSRFYGDHVKQNLYTAKWDAAEPPWKLWNERAIEALRPRVRKGDFILSLGGLAHQPIADAFPGSAQGTPVGPMFVEFGIGYTGHFSRFRVFESSAHREWCMGKSGTAWEDNDSAVIPNYFDPLDFAIDPKVEVRLKRYTGEPYCLFLGRWIYEKGLDIAGDVSETLNVRLILAGQGGVAVSDPNVTVFGHADIEERAVLMTRAICVLVPTHYREPFGGVAVEAQMCGTPAVTTDHGAFTETVPPCFRAASHRGFHTAALLARSLAPWQRAAIKRAAHIEWSLDAVAPRYEDYFQRLMDRWEHGWYQKEPVRDPIEVNV